MTYLAYILTSTVLIIIEVLQLALLARAILSWLDPMQEWRINSFLRALTEPVIMPVRLLCERMHWFEGFPIDIPFLITMILLSVIGSVLMVI